MQWILCAMMSERMCIDQILFHKVCYSKCSCHFIACLFGFLTCKAGCGCGSAAGYGCDSAGCGCGSAAGYGCDSASWRCGSVADCGYVRCPSSTFEDHSDGVRGTTVQSCQVVVGAITCSVD